MRRHYGSDAAADESPTAMIYASRAEPAYATQPMPLISAADAARPMFTPICATPATPRWRRRADADAIDEPLVPPHACRRAA